METKENINFIFQLNNKGRSGNFFMLFIVSGVVFVGAAFYFVATNMNQLLIIDIVVAVIYFILFNKIKPSFFEFLVSEDSLQINYYPVSTAVRSYQSIEVPMNQLKNFNIKKSLGGIRKDLILSVKSKYGLADYPPISISILKKNETAQVIHVLNEILKAHVEK